MIDNRMTITRKQKWEGKQLYGHFKQHLTQETWTGLRKGNRISPNKSIKQRIKNQSKRIDKTQQNSKCRLCGDKDETINHIISDCSKLAQKEYKTRHD